MNNKYSYIKDHFKLPIEFEKQQKKINKHVKSDLGFNTDNNPYNILFNTNDNSFNKILLSLSVLSSKIILFSFKTLSAKLFLFLL